MKASYLRALEKQAEWAYTATHKPPEIRDDTSAESLAFTIAASRHVFRVSETLYMNGQFCDLVDHARRTVPDDLEFEESWVPCPFGFMWLETPFTVPHLSYDAGAAALDQATIRAVGWMKLSDCAFYTPVGEVPMDSLDGYMFLCYLETPDGFAVWSNFHLKQGEKVLDRLRLFETNSYSGGDEMPYRPGKENDELHEIRWVYTALHLMAQRLTIVSEQQTSPLAKGMARRKGRNLNPFLKVVSLRRMEYDRQKEQGQHSDREYHWQWLVRGHWRRQPFKDGLYKNIFIEAFVKGPQNMPFKQPTHTLFVAMR